MAAYYKTMKSDKSCRDAFTIPLKLGTLLTSPVPDSTHFHCSVHVNIPESLQQGVIGV